MPAPVIPHERHRRKESSSSDVCQQKGERGHVKGQGDPNSKDTDQEERDSR